MHTRRDIATGGAYVEHFIQHDAGFQQRTPTHENS